MRVCGVVVGKGVVDGPAVGGWVELEGIPEGGAVAVGRDVGCKVGCLEGDVDG